MAALPAVQRELASLAARALFDQTDKNQDGVVDFDEFSAMMSSVATKQDRAGTKPTQKLQKEDSPVGRKPMQQSQRLHRADIPKVQRRLGARHAAPAAAQETAADCNKATSSKGDHLTSVLRYDCKSSCNRCIDETHIDGICR